jgi:UDPglucose 6-dehydrogenase
LRESASSKIVVEKSTLPVKTAEALENPRADLAGVPGTKLFTRDPYEAARDAYAIAIITEWDLYRTLDYERIYQSMAKPAVIFDGRNILDHAKVIGFDVYPIGSAPLRH